MGFIIIESRAGFWRRAIATFIDEVVVLLPLQFIIAGLFTLSSGWIQGSGIFSYPNCTADLRTATDPIPLAPSGARIAMSCRVLFFGLETKHLRIIANFASDAQAPATNRTDNPADISAKLSKDLSINPPVSRTEMLDEQGRPINGVDLDWLGPIILLVYLSTFQARTGATIGDRVVGIRIMDSSGDVAYGVPIRKIVIRYLAMGIGFIPIAIGSALVFALRGNVGSFVPGSPIFNWIAVSWIAAVAWFVVLLVQIARKRDPYYDRIAGTAVVLK